MDIKHWAVYGFFSRNICRHQGEIRLVWSLYGFRRIVQHHILLAHTISWLKKIDGHRFVFYRLVNVLPPHSQDLIPSDFLFGRNIRNLKKYVYIPVLNLLMGWKQLSCHKLEEKIHHEACPWLIVFFTMWESSRAHHIIVL